MSSQDIGSDVDLGPLAPVPYGAGDGLEDEGEGPDDGGFSDPARIVRIWLTDGQLTRVRVSPVWYAKLGERPLEQCFAAAFRIANAHVAPIPEPVEQDEELDSEMVGLPELNAQSLARLRELFADVNARLRAADSRPPAVAQSAPVRGRSKGVTVGLDPSGRAESVEFDQQWLDDAQAGSIATHVRLAALDAYRRFVPRAPEPTEFDDVMQEHRILMAAARALLRRKGTR